MRCVCIYQQAPLTIHSSDIVDIRASDIITSADSLKRKIEVIDRRNNSVHDTFIITLKSNNYSSNMYSQLRDKTFSGSLSIESDNEVLFSLESKNGSLVEPLPSSGTVGEIRRSEDLIPTCKVSLIHGCVSQKIKEMSIFAYGLCLYAAPECYGGLWAECAFNFCVTGEQR